jgi:hypothetical protein
MCCLHIEYFFEREATQVVPPTIVHVACRAADTDLIDLQHFKLLDPLQNHSNDCTLFHIRP